MNDIRAWSTAVCMAALGCSALRLLAPKTCGNVFSLVVSSFFLCALVLPVLQFYTVSSPDISFLPPEIQSDLLQEKVNTQLQEQVKEAAESLVNEAMAVRGISAKKVEVTTDISTEGGISMKQVTILVDKQTVPIAAVVREVLERQLVTTVVIKTEE